MKNRKKVEASLREKSQPSLPILEAPQAKASPVLSPELEEYRRVVVKMSEAIDEKNEGKFAIAGAQTIGAVLKVVGLDTAEDEEAIRKRVEELDVPTEFFASLPKKLRTYAAFGILLAVKEEAEKVFE